MQIESPFTHIVNDLIINASIGSCDGEKWIRYSLKPVEWNQTYDHIDNFIEWRQLKEYNGKKIEVIDSYLVLDNITIENDSIISRIENGEIII